MSAHNLYIPFHPGDYLADTAHLTTAEHGAYILLILNYWQRGEPLPDDDRKLRGVARMSAEEWSAARETVLEFFERRDGMLWHKRIEDELEKARIRSDRARENGARSATVRRERSARSTPVEQPLNDRSAPVQRPLSKGSTNQEQVQEQVEESATAASSSAGAGEKLDLAEIKRRCVQATGWQSTDGVSAIADVIAEGHDFEGRVLPMLRTIAAELRAQGKPPPRLWAFALKAIRDPTRRPAQAEKVVEMVWVPVNSAAWRALVASGRKEAYLRSMLKPGPGGEGIHWPASDLPDWKGKAA